MPISNSVQTTARSLLPKLERFFELSGHKIRALDKVWNPAQGAPVFTVNGQYTSRGWTEWTQGFQFGSSLLQFDATGEEEFLEMGRTNTLRYMSGHVSHVGVHDHGFNNISTYGNLWRLICEEKIPDDRDRGTCQLALKVSGAIQAARWTPLHNGGGYIYSFNGPHSLFIDTIRSLRSLAVASLLGQSLMGEHDQKISLLERLLQHLRTTLDHSVYYGLGRDAYDVPHNAGRTAHECIFNTNDGRYRCPNSQQGYSPFSTWTRGLAWAICGIAEQLEFLSLHPEDEFPSSDAKEQMLDYLYRSASVVFPFYIEHACSCGVPVWDTGAPNLHYMGDFLNKPADPYNAWEPIDSSAAAIAAQGFLRLGNHLIRKPGQQSVGEKYRNIAFIIANTLFDEPYLSVDPGHQGLILHSIYHRPNGWDCIHPGQKVPNGESSMWGDYHARELALMLLREAKGEKYYSFSGFHSTK